MRLNSPVANEEVGQHQVPLTFKHLVSVVFQSHRSSKELEAPVCSSSNRTSVPGQRGLAGSQKRVGPEGLLPTGAGLPRAPAAPGAAGTALPMQEPFPRCRVSVLCMIGPRTDPVFRQRWKAALFLLLPQTSRRHRMPMRRQWTSFSPTSHSPEVMKTTSH